MLTMIQTAGTHSNRSVVEDSLAAHSVHLHVLLYFVSRTGHRTVSLVEAVETPETALSGREHRPLIEEMTASNCFRDPELRRVGYDGAHENPNIPYVESIYSTLVV